MKRSNVSSCNSKPWYLVIFLLLFFIFMTAFSFFSCESKEKVIKIGNQGVMSGGDRFYGQDQTISLEIAASELSPVKVGGFDYRIDLITKDDEGNAEKAFLISQELVEENAVAVIGSTFNGTTKASIPVYAEYGIPIVTPSAQGVEISIGFNNFYRMIINNSQKIENIADFISETVKSDKLILIDNGQEYSVNLIDHLIEIFESRNITYEKRYSIQFDQEEYNVLAENLLIDEPDTIFFCADYNELAQLITKVRKLELKCDFITEEMGMDDGISAIADKLDLEGLIAIVSEPPSLARYTEDKRAIDFWRKYSDYLEKTSDREIIQKTPGPYSPYAYDALYIIIESMKKANSVLPEDFSSELKKTSYDGIAGHIEFNSNGERVSPLSTIFMMKNGDWVRYQQ